MKIMRSNYDKPHRCPEWSGPGWSAGWFWRRRQFQDLHTGVEGTSSLKNWVEPTGDGDRWGHWARGVVRCETCGVYVLPHWLIWFEVYTYIWKIKWAWRNSEMRYRWLNR